MNYPSVKEENRAVEHPFSLAPDAKIDLRLSPYEEIWATLYPFLLSRGYKLRPRYHPDWVPSWTGDPDRFAAYNSEDGIRCCPKVVDAVREDGTKVMLKCVDLQREELEIGLYLSSKPRSDDPRNYCVPILDVVLVPACETHAIAVMPLLYEHWLEFLHEHRIAHRDFCYYNIMIDPTRLLPKGFHPFGPLVPEDGRKDMYTRFKWKSRWSVRPNRYYVIDFGLSSQYDTNEGVRDLGDVGQDRSVPEMSDTVPYDPFPADVYQMGSMLLRIYKHYLPNRGIEKLKKLADRMTDVEPSKCPTAREVAREYDRLTREMGYFSLRQRIWSSKFPYPFTKKLKVVLGYSLYPP